LSLRVDLSVAGFLAGAAFIGGATAAPSVGSLAKEASTIAGVCAAAFAARFAVGLGAFATFGDFLGTLAFDVPCGDPPPEAGE